MTKRITREFVSTIPEFKSHLEARQWFKNQFGDNFFMTDSQMIDGEKIYFYHLVVDRKIYERGMKELQEKSFYTGMDLPMSYHSVEITENGSVHVVF
ncbi:hypothetical protein [Aeribacillus pallidus]|uniref:hypothetical protein n=1 Tax=Aeribacillus pallidus TaxID=33936 RepID=UPI003D198BD2